MACASAGCWRVSLSACHPRMVSPRANFPPARYSNRTRDRYRACRAKDASRRLSKGRRRVGCQEPCSPCLIGGSALKAVNPSAAPRQLTFRLANELSVAYPISNVNLRAGPDTDYPVIVMVPDRAPIEIQGCLGDYTWCDVVFQDSRGWMRSIYLAGSYQGYYYPLRDYAPRLGYPVVEFDIGEYWDAYYQDRSFYQERPQWSHARREGFVDRAVFYDRLEPYGDWVWLQGQYVWVPANVDRQW